MLALLYRCIEEDHGDSWGDFWILMENAASQSVRRLLRQCGIDELEAEDVIQEIFLKLQKDDMRKLRSFRGNSESQLGAWLKRIAMNHTLDWLDKRRRRQQRKEQWLITVKPPVMQTSTEQQLLELLEDIKASLTNDEIEKLDILAGLTALPRPITERTLRRWRQQLRKKYKPT